MSIPFYNRALQSRLSRLETGSGKIKLILGPRQSGKTTLLCHHIGSTRNVVSINLQDRRMRRMYEIDDARLVRELEAAVGADTVFIDEIQKVPELLEDVQYLYDRYPGRYRFFLTGSSSRQLKRRSSNLLPGRVHTLLLPPVMLAEQREALLLPLRSVPDPRFPFRSLEDYLLYGNLPGLYQESRDAWADTLAGYVELYIENEIRQESMVNDMGAFVRFLRLAALESGQFVNFTKLARAVGVAVNTLRNFYQILEDTYVGIRLLPFGRNRKRIMRSPRFLFFDIGVRHLLAELPLNQTLLTLGAGLIFEQSILTELHYRCCFHGKGFRLSTWRTASGAEVDAIIETPDEFIPIEIKWTENPSPRDARHLETFMNLHNEMSKRAYLICRAPARQKLSDRTTVIPWNEF